MSAGNVRCVWLVLLGTLACGSEHSARGVGSDRTKPPAGAAAAELAAGKPSLVNGALPVAPFVAEQRLVAPLLQTVVYVGATWCEPCQRFHAALAAGELDAALRGVRFIEYDYDAAKDALAADGYQSRLIPLFALPAPDGRASAHMISGSIKGEGAVDNIVPRLKDLLAADTTYRARRRSQP